MNYELKLFITGIGIVILAPLLIPLFFMDVYSDTYEFRKTSLKK